jgi:methyltransferase (TIGR00027 family)
MLPASMDTLATTALWTAVSRARESIRPDRLFEDPLSSALAGSDGFASLDRFESGLVGAAGIYVPVRTRYFDDFLLRTARDRGIRQVVLLAAGMDARAFRLSWPEETELFEIDRSDLLAEKDSRLAQTGAVPRCRRHAIGVDLRFEWSDALLDAGFQPETPSVWLAEGLLYYLTESTVHLLLSTIRRLAAKGSHLGADLVNSDFLWNPVTRPGLWFLASHGVTFHFGTNAPEGLFWSYGWRAEVKEPGDSDVSSGRWPYPSLPRSIPSLPRAFFVTAKAESHDA